MSERIEYRDGFRYQLDKSYAVKISVYPGQWVETDYIRLSPNGDLVIKAGYAWDGPSGPTIDTKSAMRGSLIHDALYQLMRLELLDQEWRGPADWIYEKACIADGMWKIRAWAHFRALRAFGAAAAEPGTDRPILTAP